MSVSEFIERTRDGFQSIGAPEEQAKPALSQLEQWLTLPPFAAYQPALTALIDASAWSLLLDSFYRVIPFGTGGRRGPVGIGPNRINPYTISTSVEGHAQYLKHHFAGREELHVVIAYDVRVFRDLRQRYDPSIGSPVQDLSSKQLGHIAAEIYAANGIIAHLLPVAEETYISTPELSYLIRALDAVGGLNVSASHNHPDDNGGKFYNHLGGQPVPPKDQELLDLVLAVEDVPSMPMESAVAQKLVRWITPETRQGYIDLNAGLHGEGQGAALRVAYSPMHGTGEGSVGRALRRAGYEVEVFPAQATPDGAFPNVRFQMPNPEVREAMQDVIDWARGEGADLVLATDPDADRLGLAAPNKRGEWRFFTGNEIAALLTWHRLARWREEAGATPPIVVKTEVTTALVHKITDAMGGTCLGGLLVGFKYIGQALEHWDDQRSFLGMVGTVEQFALGTEESHGYLISPEIRDKDAAGAAVLLVEFASRLKSKGSDLCEALDALYMTHGYHCNRLVSMVMEGAEGLALIRQMQAELRANPPSEIAGIPVVEHFDHWNEQGRFGEIVSETDRSGRNVQVFHLEGDIRLILRPSGTEPKAKMYIEVPSKPQASPDLLVVARQRAEAEASAIAEAFTQEALRRVGVTLPLYALRTSDLLSIDNKVAFAKAFVRAWKARMDGRTESLNDAQMDADIAWLREATSRYGKEPKAMLQRGIDTLLDEPHHADLSPLATKQLRRAWALF